MSATTASVDAQPIPRGITVREFAHSQKLHETTVRRGIGTGEIPSYKIGSARRIPLSYLEQLQRCDPVESAIDQIASVTESLTDDGAA
jgi:excisionase family DNA binding protein